VMDPDERAMFLTSRILGEVNAMVGHPVRPEEPLIAAGERWVSLGDPP
jgi:hypothetical protein